MSRQPSVSSMSLASTVARSISARSFGPCVQSISIRGIPHRSRSVGCRRTMAVRGRAHEVKLETCRTIDYDLQHLENGCGQDGYKATAADRDRRTPVICEAWGT